MKKKALMAAIVVAAVCLAGALHDRLASLLVLVSTGSGCVIWFLVDRHLNYLIQNPPLALPERSDPLGSGLVAHWKMDEVREGKVLDASSNGLHGRVRRQFKFPLFSKPSVTDGVNGKALLFKGRQWVEAGNKPCFAAEQFTVTAWVWRQREELKPEANVVPTIIAKSTWPSSGWWLCADFNSLNIDMGISYGEGFTHVKSGYALPFEEWHFIGVTMDNLNHEVQFFVDGEPYGERIRGVKTWVTNWDRALFIGEYDSTCRWPWLGKIGDVRFYNVILSPKEISGIYLETSGRIVQESVTKEQLVLK